MSKINSQTRNKKNGTRRARDELARLEEAIAAARGLSDKLNAEAEIAAAFIGPPRDHIRAELLELTARHEDVIKSVASRGAGSAPHAVVVERKNTRRRARCV